MKNVCLLGIIIILGLVIPFPGYTQTDDSTFTENFVNQVNPTDTSSDKNLSVRYTSEVTDDAETTADDELCAKAKNFVTRMEKAAKDAEIAIKDKAAKETVGWKEEDATKELDKRLKDAKQDVNLLLGWIMNNNDKGILSSLTMVNGYEKKGAPVSYNKLYMEEVDNLLSSYLGDIINGGSSLANDYKGFFRNTHDNYKTQLDFLNQPEPKLAFSEDDKIQPEEHLDKPLKNYTKKGLDIDFHWAGVNDMYKHYTPRQILHLVWDNFKNKSVGGTYTEAEKKALERNLAWFLNVWPPASEMLVMDNNYNTGSEYPKYSETAWKNKQAGAYKNDLLLDEYGMLRDSSDMTENAYYGADVTAPKKTDSDYSKKHWSVQTGSYNNRCYGYRYNDGGVWGGPGVTNTTIQVTVGGKSYELTQNVFVSPIVLDMDGDGKLEASQGEWLPHGFSNSKVVEFDMNGDGFVDICEWVGPNDGLLLLNYSGGSEIDANLLFGDADGFRDGFEKLSALDANSDGVLSGDELQNISVWQDKNCNGKAESGEVRTVADLNITEISTSHERLVSSFMQNGTSKMMWDWYPVVFEVKRKK